MNTIEQKVKQMYSDYTYPKYDEYMDKFAPIPHQYNDSLFLEQINHYIYKGKKTDFNSYNILVAGVGLGSDIINMGFFFKKYKTRMVGIDLSPTSLDICKKRLYKYNLENDIDLIEMSLLDLNPTIHGTFDLIICEGVLHHLEDPQKGLDALKGVLKDDGCIHMMVYGKYGRTGVYQMQDLMKKINYNTKDFPNKIQNFKTIHKQLPENNWFKLGEHLISDHKVSDEGIVDLILHHQDRSYTIPELYEWINNSKLHIVDFSPETRYKYKYNISGITYSNNIINKYAINEIFFGDIIKHTFYVSKHTNTKASINNLDNIILLVCIRKENLDNILEYYKLNKINILTIHTTQEYKIEGAGFWSPFHNIKFQIKMNDIIYTILNNIDNKKTTKKIFDSVREKLNIKHTNQQLLDIFKPIYETFELYDLLLLKNKVNN